MLTSTKVKGPGIGQLQTVRNRKQLGGWVRGCGLFQTMLTRSEVKGHGIGQLLTVRNSDNYWIGG